MCIPARLVSGFSRLHLSANTVSTSFDQSIGLSGRVKIITGACLSYRTGFGISSFPLDTFLSTSYAGSTRGNLVPSFEHFDFNLPLRADELFFLREKCWIRCSVLHGQIYRRFVFLFSFLFWRILWHFMVFCLTLFSTTLALKRMFICGWEMRDLTCFIVIINIRFVYWNQFLNLKIV